MRSVILFLFMTGVTAFSGQAQTRSWIRINLLGYTTNGIKVAVWCSKEDKVPLNWKLVDAGSKKAVAGGKTGKAFGAYGPFRQTSRIDFSSFVKPGLYYLEAGGARSPEFEIGRDVYKGAADFCLRYMRQQRTGFNPFLKDSCHTHDGYVLYGGKAGIEDSTRVDVVGGWHDASDYLQYSTTSANATYHLLMAYRDFPHAFTDTKQANGLEGANGMADIMDEARWGLDWLLKMHPRSDWMFNQIADDRDHMGMRIPGQDTFYGRGYERPVYFVSGEPQQRGKFMNTSTGTSSIAGKFAGAFALGSSMFRSQEPGYASTLYARAQSAYAYGLKQPGYSQTASNRSPYIYTEMNWTDDMELGATGLFSLTRDPRLKKAAMDYARLEKITPWMGTDTAAHYQWYPFHNVAHYELAKQAGVAEKKELTGYYRQGIEKVWAKAKQNAFYRGIPFIWCSNNLTTSFAIQCGWYKKLSGDKTFEQLEQANIDWLLGCNPWGTSMVYGLPSWGDTPVDPHSAFTHIKKYPIDGGLVDGPVYTSIYKGLIGITLYEPDEYAEFQSDLAVYHDDYGDYSTNEPTMDGTASLIYLLASRAPATGTFKPAKQAFSLSHGAINRGDSLKKKIALVFTGHEYAEGGDFIHQSLQRAKVKASFFFTGDFFRNPAFTKTIVDLKNSGHYIAPHSDKHLLYCDWNKRDSLLVTKEAFTKDLLRNYSMMSRFGIREEQARYFLPPYEWYNDSIAAWTQQLGFRLINYTPGTRSHADYTTDADRNYRSSEEIWQSIVQYEQGKPAGLNGFILLMHIGAGPGRSDKFYQRLPELLRYLMEKGYQFQRVDELLKTD